MMKKAIRLEIAMPTQVSQPMRLELAVGACSGCSLQRPGRRSASSSSTSCELCQKKR